MSSLLIVSFLFRDREVVEPRLRYSTPSYTFTKRKSFGKLSRKISEVLRNSEMDLAEIWFIR